MCSMCQGMAARELIGQVRDTILRHGWAIQYVESDGSRESPTWRTTFYRPAGGRPIPALQLYFPSTHPLAAGP